MSRVVRFGGVIALAATAATAVSVLSAAPASAHPLGNFTTNTSTRLVVSPSSLAVRYTLDMAEIPALQVRQTLGVVTGPVPASISDPWRDRTCSSIGEALDVTIDGRPVPLTASSTRSLSFVAGQAGLTTLRLECAFSSLTPLAAGTDAIDVAVRDNNFGDRVGWREITAVGDRLRLSDDVAAVSLTQELRSYPSDAATSPLRQRNVSFSATPDATRRAPTTEPSVETDPVVRRGNDGLTQRFQSLVAERELTIPFALGAALLALILGGLHALAPGHGKTIMAAYAVSRRGRKGDILAIGGTVALTHTVGILVLGALVTASSRVSPSGALRWTSIASGALVVCVGVSLVRSRLRGPRLLAALTDHAGRAGHVAVGEHSHGHDDNHRHSHSHETQSPPHSHSNSHPHAHPHPHESHAHPHPHRHPHEPSAAEIGATVRAHPTDERFVVTSHAHGGWQHDHVLPAPGAIVRRRELVVMGLAGGLVPSPSALVVLLGAIALGRIPFGLALVVFYGVGLAVTLIAAGLLMVRFESKVRRWTQNRGTVIGGGLLAVANALPLLSGLGIIGAGMLLLLRSIRMA